MGEKSLRKTTLIIKVNYSNLTTMLDNQDLTIDYNPTLLLDNYRKNPNT